MEQGKGYHRYTGGSMTFARDLCATLMLTSALLMMIGGQ